MRRTAITIARPTSVHVRLTEAQDAGAIAVNSFHFDLRLGIPENITPALDEGVNVLTFLVTTRRFRERVLGLDLDRPHWAGRFELLIDTRLMSVFHGQGVAILGGATHPVARMELSIFTPVVLPEAQQLAERLRRVPGMTDSAASGAANARPALSFRNGVSLLAWKNRAGVDFVAVTDERGAWVYSGYVGWVHAAGLRRAIEQIRADFQAALP
jgi:hypothetical protein